MARSWLDHTLISRLHIIDPNTPDPDISDHTLVSYSDNFQSNHTNSDVVVLAVKPQMLRTVSRDIEFPAKTLILSIAAGQNLKSLELCFSAQNPIIRTMPNTPAAIGKGISVSVANSNVLAQHKDTAQRLMACCGIHEWIEDEDLMDSVTALSGSGPAYVFYMIEALTRAGKAVGLSPELANILARQTVIGSAALAESEANYTASTLRENVTSPGGTTQAGLDVLMDGRFQDILCDTLQAAKDRSIALNDTSD